MVIYERLNLINFIRAVFSKDETFYSKLSRSSQLIHLFIRPTKIRRLKWRLHDISKPTGELMEEEIYADLIKLADDFDFKYLEKNDFIKAFYPEEALLIKTYLLKLFNAKMSQPMFLINFLSLYKAKHHLKDVTLHMVKTVGFDVLVPYAESKGIKLVPMKFVWINTLRDIVTVIGYTYIYPLVEAWRGFFNNKEFANEENTPLVSAWYNYNPVTLDRDKRSSLFLFLDSNISWKRILLHFESKAAMCTDEMTVKMDYLGVKYVARKKGVVQSSRVPVFNATGTFFKTIFNRNVRMIPQIYKTVMNCHFFNLSFLPDLCKFNAIFATHYDFYKTLNIKVNVGLENFAAIDVPKYLALKEAGGVRVCYQISNIVTPQLHDRGAITDTYFAFGPYYRKPVMESRSYVKNFLYSGYITDYCFTAVKSNAKNLRENLLKEGVKLIITFFDEGFGNDECQLTKKEAEETHNFFAQLVLDHPDIAVIHKPKKITFSPDSDLVKKAATTKRFVILNEGRYLINTFPAEAALASDITVGMLQSGTTNLESLVAGVPTYYLDLHKLYFYDEYRYGKDVVAFDSREKLREAFLKLKDDPQSYHLPKELEAIVSQKDPFQDGKAIARVGTYMADLLAEFDQGKSREEALAHATKKYWDKWGAPLKGKAILEHAYTTL